jgi:hypothetical protein
MVYHRKFLNIKQQETNFNIKVIHIAHTPLI